MKIYDYFFDHDNLEVFPRDIWEDPDVVFHGTSDYHSNEIEKNGFIPATPPFELDDAKELIRVLQLPDIQEFDSPDSFGMRLSQYLSSYVIGIENNDFRLSFAYLSYICVIFASGPSKGGQTLGNIRRAKEIINRASQTNPDTKALITEPVKKLWKLENEIANAKGVIYAVKLSSPYKGISEEYGNIHSSAPIAKENIIGKVILPNGINTENQDIASLKERNRIKLMLPGKLGTTLYNKNQNDEDTFSV